jgi:hypothetical protein
MVLTGFGFWWKFFKWFFWGKIGESPSVSQQKNEKDSLKKKYFFLSFKNNQ